MTNTKDSIVNLEKKRDEKKNQLIKKQLGSFVKDMQALKAKHKRLEERKKMGNPVGISKKNKKKKNKDKK